jgi:hypothetical protein
MNRGQTTTVGPTAKHDAAGASTRRVRPIALGNHQYCLARPVSRLVGIHCITPPCLRHIRPAGQKRRPAKCCAVYRCSTDEQLAVASRRPLNFDPIRTFVSSVTIELVPAR